jgi:hypothetical protein
MYARAGLNRSRMPTARALGEWLLLSALLSTAIADIVWQARAVLFSFDEIVNVDSALNLVLHGDYTTKLFGAFPFDPIVSSGILTTWTDAVVLLAGGSLFEVRIVGRLLQLIFAVVLAVHFLGGRGVERRPAALIALALWLALLPSVDAELRTATRGELWSGLILAAGMSLSERRPCLASFGLGLSVWLGKMIYLPFAAAFLLAHVFDRAACSPRERRRRVVAVHTSAFLAPLLIWMGLIWVSRDAGTLVRWLFTQATFVLRHSSDLSLPLRQLPTLTGWRFEPAWGADQSFLAYPLSATLPFLAPIAIGLALLACLLLLARTGASHLSARERRVLIAGGAVTPAFVFWFLAFDPTQWGRHLLPAAYVAIGLGFYSITAIVTQPRAWAAVARRLTISVCFGAALWSCVQVSEDIRAHHWRSSYSRSCDGRDLSAPPCMMTDALRVLQPLLEDICPHVGDNINDVCLIDERARFVEALLNPLRAEHDDRVRDMNAAYLLKFFQVRAYRDWHDYQADLRPLACGESDARLRERLAAEGIDVSRLCGGGD